MITSSFQRYSLIMLVAGSLPLAAATAAAVPGVGNFQKVDDHVYRGAQPTEEGFKNLAKLGIQTVVDLQEAGDSRYTTEEKWVQAAGMKYINIPMKGMTSPTDQDVGKALAILEDSSTGPIFIHCHRGADRTGGIIACYRIEHDKWKNDKALAEARKMGMSWFQTAIQNYVRGYRPKELPAAKASPELAGNPPPSTPPPAPKLP